MVKRKIYKSIDRSRYNDYLFVANNFYSRAELAKEFEYWNAAGLLIVHSQQLLIQMLYQLNTEGLKAPATIIMNVFH